MQVNVTVPTDGAVHVLAVELTQATRFSFAIQGTDYTPGDHVVYGVALVPWTSEACSDVQGGAFVTDSERFPGQANYGLFDQEFKAGLYEVWMWNNKYQSPWALLFHAEGPREHVAVQPQATLRPIPQLLQISGEGLPAAAVTLPAETRAVVAAWGVSPPLLYVGNWTLTHEVHEESGPCHVDVQSGMSLVLSGHPQRDLSAAVGHLTRASLRLVATQPPVEVPGQDWTWSLDVVAFRESPG